MKPSPTNRPARHHDWDALAREALDAALQLPHGEARSEALRKAGQLRLAAEMKQMLTTRPNRPEES
jgi:hypothetical protein